jgi:hypothetical protein
MEAARRGACLILALAALAGCGGSDDKQAAACAVDKGVLPEWARTGFSEAEPEMPHVLGDAGEITAILFGYPLAAPPRPDHAGPANKILWVPHDTPQTFTRLRITARHGDQTVKREVDLGPSYVNLPQRGCWHLTLAWAGHEDALDLEYSKP